MELHRATALPSRARTPAARPTRPPGPGAGSGIGSSGSLLGGGPRVRPHHDDGRVRRVSTSSPIFLRGAGPRRARRWAPRWRHGTRRCSIPRRTARRGPRPGRRRPPGHRLLHGRPGPRRRGPAGRVRHERAPRLEPQDLVQRHPHRGHDAGDLRLPPRAGLRRAALHRPRHARPVRARVGDGARGAGRQRRHRAGRRPRRLHADPGGLPRDHPGQRRALHRLRPRRRHRRHPVAQPARRRRLQVQPARTAVPPTPTRRASSPRGPTS